MLYSFITITIIITIINHYKLPVFWGDQTMQMYVW